MFGVFLDGFFFITVVSTQGVGKSDFILKRVVNCRFGKEKHPWHDEEDEKEAEEDGEEQEDDADDDDDEVVAEHERCGAALLQGLRPSQEDRILCVLDIPLRTFGKSFLFLVQEGFFFTQNLKFKALLSLFLSFVLYMGWQQQWQPREGTHLTRRPTTFTVHFSQCLFFFVSCFLIVMGFSMVFFFFFFFFFSLGFWF